MSVKTHLTPANTHTSSRGKCFWLRLQAKALLVVGMRSKAHEVFQDILDLDPQDVLALNSLGFNELNDRRWVQALGFFERALALTPANANAHFNTRSEPPFKLTKKWTVLGMASAWCWCVNGDLMNLWWPSSATPNCKP
jgi:tetratricopeptide (TPR) repeat protein